MDLNDYGEETLVACDVIITYDLSLYNTVCSCAFHSKLMVIFFKMYIFKDFELMKIFSECVDFNQREATERKVSREGRQGPAQKGKKP